jgi:inner membrane protein
LPNLKQHLAISGVASAATYFAMCKYYNRQPDLGELLVCEGFGLFTGVAPDAIEPAIHPNHRAFGHSLALGTGLTKFAIVNCCKENGDWQEFLKILLAVGTVTYVCHLIADGFTAKGLPLLGR